MGSPGDISPPSDTTAMTPARKRGLGVSVSNRVFNPDLKRSMRTQGVRRPVSRLFAEVPIRSCVLRGNISRSSPAVVMFSLFEEQIRHDSAALEHFRTLGS